MKKRIYTLVCVLVVSAVASITFAGERLLPNLKQMDNLESVYVGKSMLRMLANENTEDMNLANGMLNASDFIKYIDSIDVISADSKAAANYVRPLTEDALKKIDNLELAVQTEEQDEYVKIFVVPTADDDAYSRILIIQSEKNEFNIIDMAGKFPVNILSSLNLN